MQTRRPDGRTDGTAQPPPWVPLRRQADPRLVAGVAGGLAVALGQPVRRIRLALVGLALAGGIGFVLYGALWLVVPLEEPTEASTASPGAGEGRGAGGGAGASARVARGAGGGRSAGGGVLVAAGVLCVGVLLVLGSGHSRVSGLVVPLVVAGAGVALVWRQADAAQRAQWSQMAPRMPLVAAATARDRRLAVVRVGSGIVLVVAGGIGIVGLSDVGAVGTALAAALVAVGGLALIAAPWLWRMVSDLAAERRARIRSQERAEVAAHLHDSVLQTLALIRRNADDPREVARLARSQERDLRAWLYGSATATAAGTGAAEPPVGRRPGDGGVPQPVPAEPPPTFRAALERAAGEVEDAYGVTIDVVVVGTDPAVDDRLAALVRAAREAMVNAARHSGTDSSSVFAEAGAERVEVYVRDRGAGFDPDRIPLDRHGLAGSIMGRMQRHGGTATVRTGPGTGTEIALVMPTGVTPVAR